MQLKSVALFGLFSSIGMCQTSPHQQITGLVDQHAAHFSATSKTIWDYAELGYHEEKSSALLQQELKVAGFRVESGLAGEPTAFVAAYGQGSPVFYGRLEGLQSCPPPPENC